MGSRPEWHEEALCAQVDPELFFPEKGRSSRPAKRVCDACPVRVQCRDAGLSDHLHDAGIWGGLAQRERLRIARFAAVSKAA